MEPLKEKVETSLVKKAKVHEAKGTETKGSWLKKAEVHAALLR